MGTPRIDRLDKNLIINGNFEFWQRGVTFNGGVYGADRWRSTSGVAASGYTRQAGGPSSKSSFFSRITGTTGFVMLGQRIESSFLKHLGSEAFATVSFYAKSTSGTPSLTVRRIVPTVVDNYAASDSLSIQSFTLSTSWQRFTLTIDLTANMISRGFELAFGDPAASGSVTFDLAEIALVSGMSPMEWNWAGRDYSEEIALCQRYFEKSYNLNTNPGSITPDGSSRTTIQTVFLLYAPMIKFQQRKRAGPTLVIYGEATGNANNVSEYNTASTYIGDRGIAVAAVGETHASFQGTGTMTVDNHVRWHFTADAEL